MVAQNAPQCYVTCTLPFLLLFSMLENYRSIFIVRVYDYGYLKFPFLERPF